MAKTVVIREPDGDRIPFLRGILVQSLITAGLSFEAAWELAQKVRDQLRDVDEITSGALHMRVAELLEARCGPAFRNTYENGPPSKSDIVVHTPNRSEFFSVGILTHSLEACSIAPETAIGGARAVYDALKSGGHREIDHRALRRVIYRCLVEHYSRETANRYLAWRRFEESGRSLILLIGGVTGSGKSTISSELAYRLDIAGMQSTDMMREIIRSYLPPQAVPTLMYSSFEAWRGLPFTRERQNEELENPVVTGFLSQLNALKPALQATLDRALKEQQDIILEGVHVVPRLLDLETLGEGAVVVPLMLATTKKELLRKNFRSRGREKTARKAGRYLDHLEDIWELQSYLLNEADEAGLPIIANPSIEESITEILNLISGRIMKEFPVEQEYLARTADLDLH